MDAALQGARKTRATSAGPVSSSLWQASPAFRAGIALSARGRWWKARRGGAQRRPGATSPSRHPARVLREPPSAHAVGLEPDGRGRGLLGPRGPPHLSLDDQCCLLLPCSFGKREGVSYPRV